MEKDGLFRLVQIQRVSVKDCEGISIFKMWVTKNDDSRMKLKPKWTDLGYPKLDIDSPE